MAEETTSLRLEIVAPHGPVYEGDVQMVVLPATSGEIGILPRHAPLVAMLTIGRMRVLTSDGDWLNFAVADGFAKVQFNKVIVLADAAEEASQIDVERVERAMARATNRLEMQRTGTVPEGEDVDPFREQLALKRARNRLRVAERSER